MCMLKVHPWNPECSGTKIASDPRFGHLDFPGQSRSAIPACPEDLATFPGLVQLEAWEDRDRCVTPQGSWRCMALAKGGQKT